MNTKLDKSNVQDILALNETQKGMLSECYKGNYRLNTVQLVFQINGGFDWGLFREAGMLVVSENDALRSVFRWEKLSKPVQIILKEKQLQFKYVDVSDGNKESELSSIIKKDQETPFDLTESAFRLMVVKVAKDLHHVMVSHHHIIYDGWSTGILLKEVFAKYNALRKEQPIASNVKPTLKQINQDLVRTAINWEEKQSYWKRYLKDIDLNLLFESVGESKNTTGQDTISRLTKKAPIEKLEKYCLNNNVTKASVLYAAYGILLQKYLGEIEGTRL
ncbi:MAG: condensation domain-containing protein, partial [Bacteroidota bacterium]